MTKDKVTRNDLIGMKIGQTEIFKLPTAGKLKSARATCNQMWDKDMKFTTRIMKEEMAIVITRIM